MSAEATDHGALRPEPPKTFYEGVVQIPGFGDAPDRCRPLTPVGFCDHGHTVLGRSSCGTRYCPDHWRDWAEGAVVSMVARLAAYRHAVDGAEKRLSHVAASPPQDRRYSARGLWDARTGAYDALEAAGVRGGAVIAHPYRTNERANNLFETAKESGELDDEAGRWTFLRELAGDDWESMSRYVEASPHFHALAAGEDIDGGDAPEGWIVERIRTFKPFYFRDTESYRDMVATAYYVLTHAAEQQGRQTTTYFGDLAPASFSPEEELTAVVWDRIQREAEKAVKTARDDDETEGGIGAGGPEECPREGCVAEVIDVYYLREYLDDEDWVASVRGHRDGRDRLARLRGVLYWWHEGGDRPPPGQVVSEARLREWLESKGDLFTPEPKQVGLRKSIMG